MQMTFLLNLFHSNIANIPAGPIEAFFSALPQAGQIEYRLANIDFNDEILAALSKRVPDPAAEFRILRGKSYAARRAVLAQMADQTLAATISAAEDAPHLAIDRLNEIFAGHMQHSEVAAHCFLQSTNLTLRKHALLRILQNPQQFSQKFVQYSLIPAIQEVKVQEMPRYFETCAIMGKLAAIGEKQEIAVPEKSNAADQHIAAANSQALLHLPEALKNQLQFVNPRIIFMHLLNEFIVAKKCNLEGRWILNSSVLLILMQNKAIEVRSAKYSLLNVAQDLRYDMVQMFAKLCIEQDQVTLLEPFINELEYGSFKKECLEFNASQSMILAMLSGKFEDIDLQSIDFTKFEYKALQFVADNCNIDRVRNIPRLALLSNDTETLYKITSNMPKAVDQRLAMLVYRCSSLDGEQLSEFVNQFQFCNKHDIALFFDIILENSSNAGSEVEKLAKLVSDLKHNKFIIAQCWRSVFQIATKAGHVVGPKSLAYALQFCFRNPHTVAFIFNDYLKADMCFFELLVALASFTVLESTDPTCLEPTLNYYLYHQDSSLEASVQKQFVNADLAIRIKASQLIEELTQTQDSTKLFTDALGFAQNQGLFYVDGSQNIFKFKEQQFLLASALYKKQVSFAKILRIFARKIHQQRGQNVDAPLDFVQKILSNSNWLRSSREVFEQICALLIMAKQSPQNYLEQRFTAPLRAGAEVSNLVVSGIVLVKEKHISNAIKTQLMKYCMGANHQLRFLAKSLIVKLSELGSLQVPLELLEAISCNLECKGLRLEKIFELMDPLVTRGPLDNVFLSSYPTILPVGHITDQVICTYDQVLQLYQDDNALLKVQKEVAEFVQPACQQVKVPLVKLEVEQVQDFQAKIVPVQQEPFDLIVVASLLDNSVNLGGIARTCEIFKARQLVLGDIQDADSQTFKSCAVTAQEHLDIAEVRPADLGAYLEQKQREGYCIICLEQSQRSVMLNETKIPRKAVVLLGNEVKGVPDEFLNKCNLAIEIPQFGVVRSLNVHVSCALIVWEYVKQWHE